MYRLKSLFFFVVVAISAGCTYNVKLIDFDAGTTLQGGFNTSNRQVWANLWDGTKLTGKYVELRDDRINFSAVSGSAFAGTTFGSFSSYGTGYSMGSSSIGYAILTNPGSPVMMEILVRANLDNTGMGEARTNSGKRFKVIF